MQARERNELEGELVGGIKKRPAMGSLGVQPSRPAGEPSPQRRVASALRYSLHLEKALESALIGAEEATASLAEVRSARTRAELDRNQLIVNINDTNAKYLQLRKREAAVSSERNQLVVHMNDANSERGGRRLSRSENDPSTRSDERAASRTRTRADRLGA